MSLSKFAVLFLTTVLFGCSESNQENDHLAPLSPSDPSITTLDISNEITLIDSFDLRLKSDIENWFDLASMKEEIGFLEMGRNIPSNFRPKMDSGYYNYNFGAVGGLVLKRDIPVAIGFDKLREMTKKFISISTYKPWTTREEKYYDTNNEIIVGIETLINYERLGKMNFVGRSKSAIENSYGDPDTIKGSTVAYFVHNRVLILSYSEEKVEWFKCYLLNQESFENKDLPENIFQWNLN